MRLIRLLLLSLVAIASTGCASLGLELPRAEFNGLTIQTIQPDPDKPDLRLQLGVDFQVKNPLGIKLNIPEHIFALTIDGAPAATTGTKKSFKVDQKGEKIVRYAFELDPKALGSAIGREAEFAFTADADIDLPGYLLEGIGDVLGKEIGMAAGSLAEGLGASAGGSGGSGGTQSYKMTFGHKGKLKVPKIPKIQPPSDDSRPTVALVGKSEFMNLDNVLGDLKAKGGPAVAVLEAILSQKPNEPIKLPMGTILEAVGVPKNLTNGAVSALNTFLSLQGGGSVSSKSSQVTLPVQLPSIGQLIASVDPSAANKFNQFTSAWADFDNGTMGGLGGLKIPTALPAGMQVSAPFLINNPNEFAVNAPTFRMALVAPDGTPVLMVGTVPSAAAQSADLSKRRVSNQAIGGKTALAMTLMTEINWEQLTGGLLQLATGGSGGSLGTGGLSLQGEFTIDPGYGPITVPLNVALPSPSSSSSSADRATSGTNRSARGGSSSSTGGSSSSGSRDSSSKGSSSKDSDATDSDATDSGSKSSGSKSSGSKSSGSKSSGSKSSGSKSSGSKSSGSSKSSGGKSKGK
jgi:hypothetical protein